MLTKRLHRWQLEETFKIASILRNKRFNPNAAAFEDIIVYFKTWSAFEKLHVHIDVMERDSTKVREVMFTQFHDAGVKCQQLLQ